jgi:hypothetical protein
VKKTFPIYAITLIIIVVYYVVIRTTHKGQPYGEVDILNKNIFTIEEPLRGALKKITPDIFKDEWDTPFGWWAISHIVLYAVFGFMYPQCFCFVFFIGIGFEVLESLFGIFLPSDVKKTTMKDGKYINKWWIGAYSDIFMNLFGLLIGLFFGKVIKN